MAARPRTVGHKEGFTDWKQSPPAARHLGDLTGMPEKEIRMSIM